MNSQSLCVILDYDAAELHPEQTTRDWMKKLGFLDDSDLHLDGGSIIVKTAPSHSEEIRAALRNQEKDTVPPHLLWALVSSENPARPYRFQGPAFTAREQRLKKSAGRTTRLSALPDELGERYFKAMSDPAYGHDD